MGSEGFSADVFGHHQPRLMPYHRLDCAPMATMHFNEDCYHLNLNWNFIFFLIISCRLIHYNSDCKVTAVLLHYPLKIVCTYVQSGTYVINEFLDHTQSKAVIPVHDAKHLFANILCPLQRPDLHEVLIAPSTWELVVTPWIVHSEQRQVVAFGLVKFGFLLISKSLLVLDDTYTLQCQAAL